MVPLERAGPLEEFGGECRRRGLPFGLDHDPGAAVHGTEERNDQGEHDAEGDHRFNDGESALASQPRGYPLANHVVYIGSTGPVLKRVLGGLCSAHTD